MEKKISIKTKKSISIAVAVLLVLLMVVSLVIIFLINYNAFTPTAPQVFDDGQNIFVIGKANDGYKGCQFKFSPLPDGDEFTIEANSNKISTSEIIDKGGEIGRRYKVSYRYLGKNSGNNSEYSKSTEFDLNVYLQNPEFTYNETNKVIEWDLVEHADYYKIFYSGSEDFIRVNGDIHYLSVEELPVGKRTVVIMAYSNDPAYQTSDFATSQEIEIIHNFSDFTSATFNKQSKIITAKSLDLYEKVKVQIGGQEIDFVITPDIVQKVDEEYVYTFNVESYYSGNTVMRLIPYSADYYIYVGNGISVTIEQ